MRLVMTRVFPEPAPARMSSGPLMCRTASRCSGLRASRNCNGLSLPSSFYILHSTFHILHSTFHIPHFTFHISVFLFHRDALGEIPRLIHVAAAAHGDVVCQKLER